MICLMIKNINIVKIVKNIFYKVNLKYVVSPYFKQNMYLRDQNCQILKFGDKFCKIVKIEVQNYN
jgi:hypothetical protein